MLFRIDCMKRATHSNLATSEPHRRHPPTGFQQRETTASVRMMRGQGAFVTSPSTVFARPKTFPHCQLRRNLSTTVLRFGRIRACATANGTTDSSAVEKSESSSGARKLSKSEEMAALLGQDVGELKRKAEKQKQEVRRDKRERVLLALASMGVAAMLFGIRKGDPNSALNLMKFLTDTSAPVEVVGTNGKPTFVEFSATWCENCKAMSSRVFELEQEYGDRVNFVVVDGDDPNRSDIVEKFGVDGVPQFSMVSKEGEVKGNLIGLVPKEALRDDLEALLSGKGLPFPGVSLEELRDVGLN